MAFEQHATKFSSKKPFKNSFETFKRFWYEEKSTSVCEFDGFHDNCRKSHKFWQERGLFSNKSVLKEEIKDNIQFTEVWQVVWAAKDCPKV